jgi:uncharacterized protein (TIGR02145 family)
MKWIFWPFFIFCALETYAQDYLISFAGAGSSTVVTSVKVENLTSGQSTTLNGDDILRLSKTTGIKYIENNQSSELKIYPNPVNENSILEFSPSVAGQATFSVYDISGRIIAQTHSYLENSLQLFRFSGTKTGFYIITVTGNGYQYSGRYFSNGTSDGNIKINKINVNPSVKNKDEKPESKGLQAFVDMEYSAGERLLFTGVSGTYSNNVTYIPTEDKTITFNFISCVDGDDNNYPVVEIGNQIWMARNLMTTKYNDGSNIPLVEEQSQWTDLTTPGFCWYNNDLLTFKLPYGAYYNWYVLSSTNNGGKNACPVGWHIPSDDEWHTLALKLDANAIFGYGTESFIAGGKLKETGTAHWISPNNGATNETGFSALPGGDRDNQQFVNMHHNAMYWSATENPDPNPHGRKTSSENDYPTSWWRQIPYSTSNLLLVRGYSEKGYGCSVRCLKD